MELANYNNKKNRIFIGIADTSGFYSRLYDGLKELGVDCYFCELEYNKHVYDKKKDNNKVVEYCYKLSTMQTSHLFANKIIKVWHQIIKGLVFIWAMLNFDTFILTRCKGFWGVSELILYKLLGKKVIMFCLGSATRLPYLDGTIVNGIYTKKKASLEELVNLSKKQTDTIHKIEKYVDHFINLPAQAQIGRRKFISLTRVGIPISVPQINIYEKSSTLDKKKIRVFHAASYIGCRGSKEFGALMKELSEIYNVEYIHLSGVPNKRILREIQKCDFILDELYSDTPMATFAAEAAWYGKPTVVCGYFSDQYRTYYESGMCPPSLFVHPMQLREAVIKMICDNDYRENLGKQAQDFVKTKMSSVEVAKRVMSIINNNIPKNWYIDPLEMDYIMGYGLNEKTVKENINCIYAKYGMDGLCLEKKGKLKYAVCLILEEQKNGDCYKKR